ncbi:MAG: protein-(glutamine-N5) methyltransferase, release factor-specific [Pelagibacterales bacterium]|nr:protein-(glutamine-N5) methyltransferase, release factor-specific [Pelagibacterales bacterium]PPR17199.1 MAG: Release factor glutamine methyltransferase [Alphaproteobacteria bacterium MarineAlpha9_Bin3]|tara:strand:- start:4801 stop:5652 length:852 start_codon:yes stop_codon:yes gene_type:complete
MMKLSNILLEIQQILKKANIEEPLKESKLLICHVLCSNLEIFLLETEKEVSPRQKNNIYKLAMRRAKGEPFAYLTGAVNFYKNKFYVNNNVLIPRPETEGLIEVVLKYNSNKNTALNILDIGVGSGIILASLLQELPNALGIGTDISIDALKVAYTNLTKLNIIHRAQLLNSNWVEGLKNNTFDIVTCNPPYIANEHIKNLNHSIKKYEPLIALQGGIDGLDSFRSFLPLARKVMKKNAMIALEIGFDQSEKLKFILYNNKFTLEETIKDISGNKRIMIATAF